MKEILYDIVKPLVDKEDEIKITERENENTITLELSVAKEDMGKVIGRKGRIAKAVRTVIKAIGNRKNKKIIVEII